MLQFNLENRFLIIILMILIWYFFHKIERLTNMHRYVKVNVIRVLASEFRCQIMVERNQGVLRFPKDEYNLNFYFILRNSQASAILDLKQVKLRIWRM